jgi:hypothetical protein
MNTSAGINGARRDQVDRRLVARGGGALSALLAPRVGSWMAVMTGRHLPLYFSATLEAMP